MPATAPSDPAAPHPDAVAALQPGARWQVHLLGRIEARNGDVVITRFNSQPTALLLARLALQPQRVHPREELAELLWPGAPAEAARNRLRQALSTLRRLLEPPGTEAPPVLLADGGGLRIHADAVVCDALEFERCFRQRLHGQARALYRGELMPGCYDDWVQDERSRLAALFDRLDGDATAPAPPPLLPATAPPPLPSILTRFFGRETELAALLRATTQARLVTLSGVGGCGKTRLALEAARAAQGFDWLAFVPLAECDNAAQAVAQLRASLDIAAGTPEPLEQVLQALAQRRVLLVLDNFEQLVAEGGAELVEQLLARAPQLHLLVTSRRVLGLAGEHELPLVPLPLPAAGAALDEVARNPGAALFMDRARSVRPDFAVNARNHEALAALCRALEGVPLAIELAAARCRAFSLQELHDALARPLALLERTGARAGRRPRHDSLRGAIEWSWRLLDVRQQRFLAALSVFRGGWTVADAQAVCDEPAARERLEALVADSLLSAAVGAQGTMRFRMLELIRDYLADKLEPTRAQALRGQHRAHVLTLALGLQARGGGARAGALDADEMPNVQQALRSAVEDDRADLALTLGLALRGHWDSQGIDPELLALLCRAADGAPAGMPALPAACSMLATLLLTAGDVPGARAMAERALVLAEDRPAPRAAALCAWVRVQAEGERVYDGLVPRLEEALRLADGQPELMAPALSLRGWLALRVEHDAVAAQACFERAAAAWLAAGRPREARLLRFDRAICLLDAVRLPEALAQAQRCEQECDDIGERARRVAAINLQGVILARQRRWADATEAYVRCARESWLHHQHYWLAFALWNLGRNLARLRQPAAAGRLMAFSASHWTRDFGALDAVEQRYLRLVRRLVQAQLGAAGTEQAWRDGEAMRLPQAVALAQQCSSALPVTGRVAM